MFARIRSLIFSINASYWFWPALFALAGFVLALTLVQLDRNGASDWLSRYEALHPARPDGASNMLTVLAGSMIGVASTVFSITIAAVAYASGTYGPRLLTNFMEDKGNQLSLATFIGTFVFAITVLRTIRTEDEAPVFAIESDALPGFVPQLSLLVAFGLMIVSVAVLVYFLHHIPSSIRINAVLEGIGRHTLDTADQRYPRPFAGVPPRLEPVHGIAVNATHAGYVRFVDLESLSDFAEHRSMAIALQVRTGDFVHVGKPIARLSVAEAEEDWPDAVRDCFALGGSRTPEQDIEFSIDELVEIALRALSPGINDPFTAINAVHWLGAVTARLGNRDLQVRIGDREPSECPVRLLDDDFTHFVARGFGACRGALSTSRLATLVAFDTLHDAILTIGDEARRGLLASEGDRLMAQAEHNLAGPDLEDVRARHRVFGRMLPD